MFSLSPFVGSTVSRLFESAGIIGRRKNKHRRTRQRVEDWFDSQSGLVQSAE